MIMAVAFLPAVDFRGAHLPEAVFLVATRAFPAAVILAYPVVSGRRGVVNPVRVDSDRDKVVFPE